MQKYFEQWLESEIAYLETMLYDLHVYKTDSYVDHAYISQYNNVMHLTVNTRNIRTYIDRIYVWRRCAAAYKGNKYRLG